MARLDAEIVDHDCTVSMLMNDKNQITFHSFSQTFPWLLVKSRKFHWQPVAYLGGPKSVRAPHCRTAMIFVTILGLFLVPFRDKIAANSDQMHFLTKKCSKMRFRPEPRTQLGELTALRKCCQPVYCWLASRCATALEAWSRGRAI